MVSEEETSSGDACVIMLLFMKLGMNFFSIRINRTFPVVSIQVSIPRSNRKREREREREREKRERIFALWKRLDGLRNRLSVEHINAGLQASINF
jgi:hypothetical protein